MGMAAYATKNLEIKGWDDLKSFRVVYYRGRKNIEKKLDKIVPKKYLMLSKDDLQGFRMVEKGRVDVLVTDSRQGNHILKKNAESLSNVKLVKNFNKARIYAYMHKKHLKLAEKLAKTLDAMKQDGTFKKLVDQAHNQIDEI